MPLTNADPWRYEKLAADWSNSTTTGTSIFTGFSPLPNTDYVVEARMSVVTAISTTGFQFAVTGASTSISTFAVMQVSPLTAGTSGFVSPATWGAYGTAATGLTTGNLNQAWALLRTNATAPNANITIWGRSEIAASLVTVRAGSVLRWRTL